MADHRAQSRIDRPSSIATRRQLLRAGAGLTAAASAAALLPDLAPVASANATLAQPAGDIESLYSLQTLIVPMVHVFLANQLPGWIRNGSPSYALDVAAAGSGYFGTTSPELYGSPETAYSLSMLNPAGSSWSEALRLRVLPYPDAESASAARDALQQNATPADATDLYSLIASQIEGATLTDHTGDVNGVPVAEFVSYASNRDLLFDIQILATDTSMVGDAAYQQLVADRIVALDDLARSMASASRVQRMFLNSYADEQIRSVVTANRAPRFAGQSRLIASYYKSMGVDFGYFGQTPEDFAIRQALFADAPCVRGDALPIPGTRFSVGYVARVFATDDEARSFHDAQPTAAQDDANGVDQLMLLADDALAAGEVRGNYTLRLSADGNVPGYQIWTVRNLAAYTLSFSDHTEPFAGDAIDPANDRWQRLKEGTIDVTEQFQAGIDSPDPWPVFVAPAIWSE